jgi:hypothetical protein
VTDWFAQHSGVAAAQAGLDMAMPDGQSFWGYNFTEAINNGSVPESRVTERYTWLFMKRRAVPNSTCQFNSRDTSAETAESQKAIYFQPVNEAEVTAEL